MDIKISTGNRIVDAIGKIHFTGNLTPEAWYKTVINENGKVHLIAITILSDLLYWYRPVEIRDEHNNTVQYKKRFADKDYVQKNYEQLCDKYNISKKQARGAIETLETLGVVKRHFRTIDTKMGKCSNVMYLEIIPDVLYQLTYPNGDDYSKATPVSQKVNTSFPDSKHDVPLASITDSVKVKTNTETIADNTTKNTTSSAEVVELLSPFNLKKSDITKIIETANGDIRKIKQAVYVLRNYHSKIDSVTGFLLSAIKNEYNPVSHNPIVSNGFNNFPQRSCKRMMSIWTQEQSMLDIRWSISKLKQQTGILSVPTK